MAGVLTTTQPIGEQFQIAASNAPGLLSVLVGDSSALPGTSAIIVPNLAALALVTGAPNGASAFVLDQGETFRLDTTNAFTLAPGLIVASASGGRWFLRSKAYVIGNFTCWCQSYGFGVVGFTPGQLLVTSSAEPEIVLNMSALVGAGNQQGVFTDALNNVWLVTNTGFTVGVDLYKFPLANCLASGTPAFTVHVPIVLTGGDQTEAAIAVFDRLNNALWVADGSHGGLGITRMRHFGPKQLGYSNALFDKTIAFNTPISSNQQDAVFDGSGNLWGTVALTSGGNGGIFMFTAAQLAAGGAVAPTVLWSGTNLTGPGLGSTLGLAVARDNLLWAANFSGSNNVRAWDMSQATGNPAPARVLTSAAFNGPYFLEFDPAGNLWVNNGNVNGLMRIPAAQLGASGAVVPDVILTPAINALTSKFTFPNNPDRVGLLPSGWPP